MPFLLLLLLAFQQTFSTTNTTNTHTWKEKKSSFLSKALGFVDKIELRSECIEFVGYESRGKGQGKKGNVFSFFILCGVVFVYYLHGMYEPIVPTHCKSALKK